jgi:hypothetical protein
MLPVTTSVPWAASWTLREISAVAAPCFSIAAAIVTEIWDISPMVLAIA